MKKKCKHLRLNLVTGEGVYCEAKKCMTRMKSKCPAYHGYDPRPKPIKSVERIALEMIVKYIYTRNACEQCPAVMGCGAYATSWKKRNDSNCGEKIKDHFLALAKASQEKSK